MRGESQLEMSLGNNVIVTQMTQAINWARKYSFFIYPYITACCGMEFMSVAGPRYDLDRFGAAFPRFSPRQADLLMVVGTISHKQAPVLVKVYNQMTEPKWVGLTECVRFLAVFTTTTPPSWVSTPSFR